MKNPYKVEKARIIKKQKQNDNTYLFRLKFAGNLQKKFEFFPGQFMQVGLMGFREAPISIASSPKNSKEFFELTIRGVGRITDKLISLKIGEYMLVRGPFGNGFPDPKDKNLILIAGGCGFAPLRSVIETYKNDKNKKIQILIGCKDKNSLFFEKNFSQWKKKFDFQLILEKGRLPGFSSKSGFVTELLDGKLLNNALIFAVGPPVMYKNVVKKLIKKGFRKENIYLSLEKRMYCGQGICQHCAIGSKYICKDGPVFNFKELNRLSKPYKLWS